jgi:glycosyltransferase involved in cell wall biosynthesis
LPAFDLALVPAINPYASPLKLHEYMAAGLAVIAPDQPNLREVLVEGETALLFEAGSAEGLARAFERLASDAGLRARIGASARQAVVDLELTWQGNARRVVEAVQRLPRRKAR